MEMQRLVSEARSRLLGWGSVELPPWPGVLPKAWMHPDLFFRFFGEDDLDVFTFQPARECSYEICRGPWLTPFLVWVHKPFSSSWMTQVSEIWPPLLSSKNEGSEMHDLRGLSPRECAIGEFGPCWMIYWQGRVLGEIRILSRLCGEDLVKPAGVVIFDLEAIARFRESTDSPTAWNAKFAADDLFAWRRRSARVAGNADFPLRQAQRQWDEFKDLLEANIGAKLAFESYLTALDGLSLLCDAAEWGPPAEGFRMAAENALKPLLKKITGLIPRRPAAAKSSRESILR
ncbi:MAG: hypothetical protein HQM09_06950 [Candidatus Riflebacteria bacterium]|nr:hypothetical protein [Candidatus Riflebacteria bacterium]